MPSTPRPGAPLSVGGVYLLSDGSQGRLAIPGLRFELRDDGIELTKDDVDGDVVWHCPWPEVDVLTAAERSLLPDGSDGLVIAVIEHGGRQHRFILPAGDPDAVAHQVRAWARANHIQTFEPPAAVSRTLTVAVIVAAVATVAVLMLSAAHILHF
jgi:hypothetical protein